tara:strand:- start:82 stop:930 length:849 start_codon:yes stop_codon:yes gene_type:complete
MKKLLTLLLLFGIIGCSPDKEILDEEAILKESVKKSIESAFFQLNSLPANKPCEILTGYKELQEVEENWSTTYYSELSKDGILKYESLCNLKITAIKEEEMIQKRLEEEKIKAEVEKKRLEELNSIGNWSKSFYVDDFGDETNEGFISQIVRGKFSNSATQNSRLRVKIYISNANVMENVPWFRLYEYDGRNPIKGVYSQNGMKCRIKNQDNIISELPITQRQGSDAFQISYIKKNIKMFEELIANEGSANFVCIDDNTSSSKYMFKFDFKGYNNILKQFSQ